MYRTLLLRMRRYFVGWRLACHHLFLFLRADLFLAALLLLDLDHLQNRLARFDGLGVPNFGLYLGQVPHLAQATVRPYLGENPDCASGHMSGAVVGLVCSDQLS